MIKFKDYYEKEFWKNIVLATLHKGDLSSSLTVEWADWLVKQLRERESDQA
jgi:hypothetical protein